MLFVTTYTQHPVVLQSTFKKFKQNAEDNIKGKRILTNGSLLLTNCTILIVSSSSSISTGISGKCG